MLNILFDLCRQSVAIYLRTNIGLLEATADGLTELEATLEDRPFDPGIDLDRPLDPASAAGQELLEDLQGTILKAHARDHAAHLLVCFGRPSDEAGHAESARKIRAWIGTMVGEHVTSAADQTRDAEKAATPAMAATSSTASSSRTWSLSTRRSRG